jgi:amino acid transporter
VALLGGTTSLLLLCVFTVVNVSLLVLRRRPVDHDHFKAPALLPVVGALTCAFLAGPWARSDEQQQQYVIAGGLLAVGIVLWLMTWLYNRGVRAKKTGFRDVDSISG